MQRYNFQFTGQRFLRIENGRLAGQVRDVAYQSNTLDFWRSLEAVGGPQTYVLGGAFNCGKGQPGQIAAVSHGCPSALFRDVNILNTASEVVVMRATPAAQGSSSVRCRVGRVASSYSKTGAAPTFWAGNTLTTNGVMNGRTLTVISILGESRGAAAGVVSRSGASADNDIEAVVRLSEDAARAAGPAEDAQPLSDGSAAAGQGDFAEPPGETSAGVFASFAAALGEAFGRARAADRELFGFAEHDVTTTYLGSSTGIRLRHEQPAGRVEVTGKADGRTGLRGSGSRRVRRRRCHDARGGGEPAAGLVAAHDQWHLAATTPCCRRRPWRT